MASKEAVGPGWRQEFSPQETGKFHIPGSCRYCCRPQGWASPELKSGLLILEETHILQQLQRKLRTQGGDQIWFVTPTGVWWGNRTHNLKAGLYEIKKKPSVLQRELLAGWKGSSQNGKASLPVIHLTEDRCLEYTRNSSRETINKFISGIWIWAEKKEKYKWLNKYF